MLLYRFLESVPMGIPVMLGFFPGVNVGERIPSGEGEIRSIAQAPHFLVHSFIKPSVRIIFLKRCHAVWCRFRQFPITRDTVFAEVIGRIPLADAQVQVIFQFGLPFQEFLFRHFGVHVLGEPGQDVLCRFEKAALVVHPVFDESFVLPDQCGPVRIVEGLRMADTEDPWIQRPRHGIEVVIISGEILVCPGVGIPVDCNAGAVEVVRLECGFHDATGVFRVGCGVEPVHLAVFSPGGFRLGVTGDKVKDGVYAEELCFWFEDVHGLTDVITVSRGHLFVDLEDHTVVIHVLGGNSDNVGIFGGKSCPGGDKPGYVVMEFDVHKVKGGR